MGEHMGDGERKRIVSELGGEHMGRGGGGRS